MLNVLRADGTVTWSRLHPGLEVHDLAHYAVESTLGLDDAFFGILARGYNIEEFAAPRERRPEALLPANLPVVSLQVEHLVNLLLTEWQDGEELADYRQQLRAILEEDGLRVMNQLTEANLAQIRQRLRALWRQWEAIPTDGILELRLV